jgi:hypothetical protein
VIAIVGHPARVDLAALFVCVTLDQFLNRNLLTTSAGPGSRSPQDRNHRQRQKKD